MAIIPNGQKFHTVSADVDTDDKGSARSNADREVYTMQDILDTTGGGSATKDYVETILVKSDDPNFIVDKAMCVATGVDSEGYVLVKDARESGSDARDIIGVNNTGEAPNFGDVFELTISGLVRGFRAAFSPTGSGIEVGDTIYSYVGLNEIGGGYASTLVPVGTCLRVIDNFFCDIFFTPPARNLTASKFPDGADANTIGRFQAVTSGSVSAGDLVVPTGTQDDRGRDPSF